MYIIYYIYNLISYTYQLYQSEAISSSTWGITSLRSSMAKARLPWGFGSENVLAPGSSKKFHYTPPKTNMEPTNWWFVDASPFTKKLCSGEMIWNDDKGPATPPKTNMEPKNWYLEDEFSFGDGLFSGGYVSFGRVTPFKHQNYYKTSQFLKHHLTTKSFSMRILIVTINEWHGCVEAPKTKKSGFTNGQNRAYL